MTFKDVIDEIGIEPLAKILSIPGSHVRTMKARDSIPPKYWQAIAAEGDRRGSVFGAYDALVRMHSARFAERANSGKAA
jgi:hypothetical protein